MRVFVATKETQGYRKNDFGFCNEGELVGFGTECDGEEVDGNCGCRRALAGLESHKATTTFKVVDLPITVSDLIAKIQDSLIKAGWGDVGIKIKVADIAEEDAKELARVADFFQVGDIVEKRGDEFRKREVKMATKG
jgi:hypothetical protein